MPRVAGQIDLSKNEAILDAALQVLGERGAAASVEEIARRAGVSKQTIYNHYGAKGELVQALCERRVHEMVASLESPEALEHPEEALAAFARALLTGVLSPSLQGMWRLAVTNAALYPEVGEAIFRSGVQAGRRRLAEFLRRESQARRLNCPDPYQAADFFTGMVVSSYQSGMLLGVSTGLCAAAIETRAREAAARFIRAYAP